MTKTQLIEELTKILDISKRKATRLVNDTINIIMEWVKKNWEVKIQWFGTFKKTVRSARMWVNPKNPTNKFKVPAMNIVLFKASPEFKNFIK